MAKNNVKETIDTMDIDEVQELISAIDTDLVQANVQSDDFWKICAGLLQHKVWAYQRLLELKSK